MDQDVQENLQRKQPFFQNSPFHPSPCCSLFFLPPPSWTAGKQSPRSLM